jgi:hypothetical protein
MRLTGRFRRDGRRHHPVLLDDREALAAFLREHLWDEEVVVADAADALVFRAVAGVDVYSRLGEFGIDLPAVYRVVRAGLQTDEAGPSDPEPWEELYDSIGLSPAEIAMRRRVKALARAATTVRDVVELLEGTYFDARFQSRDGTRTWISFDPEDRSALAEEPAGTDPTERARWVVLHPDARVRHAGSAEDVHRFVLLDPPPEGPPG